MILKVGSLSWDKISRKSQRWSFPIPIGTVLKVSGASTQKVFYSWHCQKEYGLPWSWKISRKPCPGLNRRRRAQLISNHYSISIHSIDFSSLFTNQKQKIPRYWSKILTPLQHKYDFQEHIRQYLHIAPRYHFDHSSTCQHNQKNLHHSHILQFQSNHECRNHSHQNPHNDYPLLPICTRSRNHTCIQQNSFHFLHAHACLVYSGTRQIQALINFACVAVNLVKSGESWTVVAVVDFVHGDCFCPSTGIGFCEHSLTSRKQSNRKSVVQYLWLTPNKFSPYKIWFRLYWLCFIRAGKHLKISGLHPDRTF